MTLPSWRVKADEDRKKANQLHKRAAMADAMLDLAEVFEETRQEAALIRAKAENLMDLTEDLDTKLQAERLTELADQIENMAANRAMTLLGQVVNEFAIDPPAV